MIVGYSATPELHDPPFDTCEIIRAFRYDGGELLLGACPAPCPADLDGDGVVGVTDLLIVIVNRGP